MVFNRKAKLLCLLESGQGIFEWKEKSSLWVHTEHQSKKNIYAKTATSADSMLFSMPPRRITRNDMLLWDNHYYLPTSIEKISASLMEVCTAQVNVHLCSAIKTVTKKDGNKRQIFDEALESSISFPGILAEKYQGFEQNKPMVQTTVTYALIVPKSIQLDVNQIVTIDELEYTVQIRHLLDEFLNEYEIYREDDN